MEEIQNDAPQEVPAPAAVPTKKLKKLHFVLGAVVLLALLSLVHIALRDGSSPVPEVGEVLGDDGVVRVIPAGGTTTPAVVPQIVKDKAGKEYLTGEIIVVFRQQIPIDVAQRIIKEHGGEVRQRLAQLPVFLVGIDAEGAAGVEKAVSDFSVIPEVERAEPNYVSN